jgi:hypothetical protein
MPRVPSSLIIRARFLGVFLRFGRLIVINVVIFGFLLISFEGLASYWLVIRAMMTPSLAKLTHTKYDPELGWVNEPKIYLPDIYGPGVYLKTNAQGFRNDNDVASAVPAGKIRVICSGDSFTHGYGVDNSHTWCEQLSILDHRFETVNMGEDGYGVDQASLLYKRNAPKFEHQLHIFAFITDDFYRTLSDSFLGYAKPVFEIRGDDLVVKNLPVPKADYYFPWITQNVETLKTLRTFEFVKRIARSIGLADTKPAKISQVERDEKARRIAHKIFADLKRFSDNHASQLLLVYIPTVFEIEGRPLPGWTAPEDWAKYLDGESRSLRIPFINLFPEFQSFPRDTEVSLFIQKGQLPYPEAEGHLTNAGNVVVARAIYNRLVSQPAIACAFFERLPATARNGVVGHDLVTPDPMVCPN